MRNRALVVVGVLLLFCALTAAADPIAAGFNANTLAANDDGSTGALNIGFTINFFGQSYSQLYLNNNGNVTFTGPTFQYSPYGLAASSLPMIAPFWADVDTRAAGSGLASWDTGTYAGHSAFGATWQGVGYYGYHLDKTDSFQVILVDRSDVGAGDFDIYFNYGAMQWETGDASGGSGGLGGQCAHVGYTNGTIAAPGQVTYEFNGSGVCGALIDGGANALSSHTNTGVTGQYLLMARNGTVTTVPEPASMILLGTGLAGLFGRRRMAKK